MQFNYIISTYRNGVLLLGKRLAPIRYSNSKTIDGALNAIGRSTKACVGDIIFIDDGFTGKQMATMTIGKNSDLYVAHHAVGLRPRMKARVSLSTRAFEIVNGSKGSI